jgi:hypothetical protein
MKYIAIAFAAILAIGIAFGKGYSTRATEDDEVEASCSPESILAASNPDARWSHCHDKDWDGTTLLKDRLAEANEKPEQYQVVCQIPQTRYLMPLHWQMTTGDDSPVAALPRKK